MFSYIGTITLNTNSICMSLRERERDRRKEINILQKKRNYLKIRKLS